MLDVKKHYPFFVRFIIVHYCIMEVGMAGKNVYGRKEDGSYSICHAKPENRGKGACPHQPGMSAGSESPAHLELTKEQAELLNEKNFEWLNSKKSLSKSKMDRFNFEHDIKNNPKSIRSKYFHGFQPEKGYEEEGYQTREIGDNKKDCIICFKDSLNNRKMYVTLSTDGNESNYYLDYKPDHDRIGQLITPSDTSKEDLERFWKIVKKETDNNTAVDRVMIQIDDAKAESMSIVHIKHGGVASYRQERL
jgi:hypothetical protein